MRARAAVVAIALAALLLAGLATPAGAAGAGCPSSIDTGRFTSATELRSMMRTITGFGLRTTASRAHGRAIRFLERQVRAIPGMRVRSDAYRIKRWQPGSRPGSARRSASALERAGGLVASAAGRARRVPVAGAVPYSRPTGARGRGGELIRVAPGEELTAAAVRGRVVLVDFPVPAPTPYAALLGIARHFTPDLEAVRGGDYDRGGGADTPLHELLVAAGRAEAAAVVVAFDFPRRQMRGYFEPHKGTHYRVPAVFVGADERERLERLAAEGGHARLTVRARVDRARTRTLIATLPGRGRERIVVNANTDGNTWVQENGVTALVALARSFARLPLRCRPRTFEFVFATAHLHISREGTARYARRLDRDFDEGTVAFAFPIEHLGTRELLPVPRADGPGRRLVFSGEPEPLIWFAGESDPLVDTAIGRIRSHALARTAVLTGANLPDPRQVPRVCSFGGIGTIFHGHLIPTLAMISGPWSLWAPVFGSRAVDFSRAREQALAAGGAILDLQDVPRATIAGPYLGYREQRAAGTARTCPEVTTPQDAPGPG